MRFISIIILLLPILLYFIINTKKNFLNPSTAFSFLYIIKIVLPTIIYSNIDNVSYADNLFLKKSLLNDDVFFKYTLIQSLGYCMVLLGLRIFKTSSGIEYNINSYGINSDENVSESKKYKVFGFLFYLLGVFGFILVMTKVGGIAFFFSNLDQRTTFVRNLDIELYLLAFLKFAPLILIYSKKWTKDKMKWWEFVLIILAGLMTGLGGRKDLLMLVIECAVVYHFVVNPIKMKQVFNIKTLSLCCLIFLFFTTYSKLRVPGAMDKFINDPVTFYISNNDGGLIKSVAGESYVPFYVSIVDYFDKHERWEGKSFSSLTSAFIPSSIYHDKPPVDDGMYLYSIAHSAKNIQPPMPTGKLNGSSWPLATFGAMYANFGPIGVIVGMLLLGIIISYFYRKMQLSDYQFKYVIFYTIILFTFEISTLRIVQVVSALVLLSLIQFVIDKKYV